MPEFLSYVGFVLTITVALAGWFWEFTIRREDGIRKSLTKVGKIAFGCMALVSAVSIYTLVTQSIQKSRDSELVRLEKESLKTKLLQIETRIDIDHIHMFMKIDNDSALVRALRDRNDSKQIGASSRDQARSEQQLSPKQREALSALISKASAASFFFFDDTISKPRPATDPHRLALIAGEKPDYSSADESAPFRWGLTSWPNPKRTLTNDGWTDIDVRIPARLITLLPGQKPVGSFVDLAGSKVAAWIGPPGTLLVYARVYSRNGVSYPIFDALKSQDGRMLEADDYGLFRMTIPRTPPWLPQ